MHPIEEKWDMIKQRIMEEYDLMPVSFETWINPLKFYDADNDTVKIIIPLDKSHAQEYITKKYTDIFQVTISELFNSNYKVTFILEKDIKSGEDTGSEEAKTIYNINIEKANLNPKYSFDTFVVGNNNNLAHSAALAVAESPGSVYNPLFIYGGPGLGKTHLMHSIGHYILRTNPTKKVLCVDSDTFTNDLVNLILSGNAASRSNMRDKYRNIDILLLDDVQSIIGKEATQEEFFNTFNTLYNEGKQIVLTSDRPPKEFDTLAERFRSRFEWGLIVDIQAPDYETRMAILRKNMEMQSVHINDNILDYIASNIYSNIRELEGALRKVIASARIHPEIGVTIDTVKNDLRDIIKSKEQKKVTPELIHHIVSDHYGIRPEDILSTKRNSEIVMPRYVFMYLCREYLPITYKQIGNYLGGKDHTTVMHGIEKIENLIKDDNDLVINIDTIRKKINASIV